MNPNSKNIKKTKKEKTFPVPEKESEEEDIEMESENEEKIPIEDQDDKRKLIIILEKACLETGKLNKKIELLNCDEHRKYINTKLKKDYSTYRPDITHQVYIFIFL